MSTIYTLLHPLSLEIRYIGYTDKPLKIRLDGHINEAVSTKKNTYKLNWIRSILKIGLKPVIEILEEVNPKEKRFWEKYWIAQFRSWGFNLVNSTNGGEGIEGYKHTEKTKKLLSDLSIGRKVKKEIKEKISKSSKGKIFSEQHLLNLSLSQKGKPRNPKSIEKMIKSKTGKSWNDLYGKEQADIMKQKQSERMKGNKFNRNCKK